MSLQIAADNSKWEQILAQPRHTTVRDKLFSEAPCISFEIFPPKTPEAEAQLASALDDLLPLKPAFVSVTYGANGSARDSAFRTLLDLRRRGAHVLAHLTSLGHSPAELLELVSRFHDAGIHDVLALRGDPPADPSAWREVPDELRYASELIHLIQRTDRRFCVGAACYPEAHLECATKEEDLENLKRKVAAGAEFLITQVFFENAFYFDFVERCHRAGITVPIVPGIMPITNHQQIERFTRMCGSTVPRRLQLLLERYQDAPEEATEVGIEHTTRQCEELLARGAPGIHFFTLNRSRLATRVLANLERVDLPAPAAARMAIP